MGNTISFQPLESRFTGSLVLPRNVNLADHAKRASLSRETNLGLKLLPDHVPDVRAINQGVKRKRDEDYCMFPHGKRHASVVQNVHEKTGASHKPFICDMRSDPALKRKRYEEDGPSESTHRKRHASVIRNVHKNNQPFVCDMPSDSKSAPKRKGDDEDEPSEFPPRKRMTEGRLSTASLAVLPNELLHDIFNLLGLEDLWTCTQVSTQLRTFCAPRYLSALNFKPSGGSWTTVIQDNLAALMVWRRMPDFVCPAQLYCSLNNPREHHLRSLEIFFLAPQCANISTVYLTLFGDVLPACIASLLTTIRASGCLEISFSAHSETAIPALKSLPKQMLDVPPSRLQSFSSDCNVLFLPSTLPFTMSTLRHSPLTELVLKETGLISAMWVKLLKPLNFPSLRRLEIDCQCPLRALLIFLQRHPRLQSLSIHSDGKSNTAQPPHRATVDLPALYSLSGPPDYLVPLLRSLRETWSITTFSVELTRIRSTVPLISKVLDCAEHLPCVQNISITFLQYSPRIIPAASLFVPRREHRSCGASRLRISAPFDTITDGDTDGKKDIIDHCASWMPFFPCVKTLSLAPGSTTSDAELAEIRMSYIQAANKNPDDLTITMSVF